MLTNKKAVLVAASIAGLMASSTAAMAGASFPGQDSKKMCSLNNCGGKHCDKGAKNSCAGHKNSCKADCSLKGTDASAKIEDGKLTS